LKVPGARETLPLVLPIRGVISKQASSYGKIIVSLINEESLFFNFCIWYVW
jgi:hypothetical protein